MESVAKVVVFYGSETGTAEQEANMLSLQIRERGYDVEVAALDDYPLAELPETKYALFLVSTTGQGDPPKNMTKFWSFLLMKTLPADSLSGLNFTVFGLGDSSYKKYNYMGRMLHQRLQQLGAKSFLERGLGDDQAEGGYNLGLIKWKRDFFGKLKQLTGNSGPENECFSSLKLVPKPIYSVHIDSGSQYHSKDAQITQHNISNALGTVNKRSVSCGKLLLNNRCTAADHFQDVREIAFTKAPTSSFSPGDTCMIYPRNTVEDTQKMLDHCELLPSNIITLSDFEGKVVMQLPAEHLFGQLLDFSSPPKFFFFKMLAFFTEVEIYKEKINEMEYEDYYQYAIRERRTLAEILYDFKGIKIPLEQLISFVGWLKPREYSIASSHKKESNLVRLLVALVEYSTLTDRKITGICSKYFKFLQENSPVYFSLKEGTLTFPSDPLVPFMVVGPGTGIAPFISFLDEREAISVEQSVNMSRHKHLVFFGCRNKEKDWLHKDIMTRMQKDEKITLFNAFSRDQDQKVYVQHLIKDNAFRLKAFLSDNITNFRIFVAGNSKNMPQSVEKAIKEVFRGLTDGKEDEASHLYEKLFKEGRIQMETWN